MSLLTKSFIFGCLTATIVWGVFLWLVVDDIVQWSQKNAVANGHATWVTITTDRGWYATEFRWNPPCGKEQQQ